MHSIVVWMNKDTVVPSVIGPYEGELAFDDAKLLREKCHKVLVCQNTTPDKAEVLTLLTNKK